MRRFLTIAVGIAALSFIISCVDIILYPTAYIWTPSLMETFPTYIFLFSGITMIGYYLVSTLTNILKDDPPKKKIIISVHLFGCFILLITFLLFWDNYIKVHHISSRQSVANCSEAFDCSCPENENESLCDCWYIIPNITKCSKNGKHKNGHCIEPTQCPRNTE